MITEVKQFKSVIYIIGPYSKTILKLMMVCAIV